MRCFCNCFIEILTIFFREPLKIKRACIAEGFLRMIEKNAMRSCEFGEEHEVFFEYIWQVPYFEPNVAKSCTKRRGKTRAMNF